MLSRQREEASCPEAVVLTSSSGGGGVIFYETSGIPLTSFYQKHMFLIPRESGTIDRVGKKHTLPASTSHDGISFPRGKKKKEELG